MLKRINEVVKSNSRKIVDDDLYTPMIFIMITALLSISGLIYYSMVKIADSLYDDQKDNKEV